MNRAALLLVVFLLAGCNRQDTECLARIGKRVLERSQSATTEFGERVHGGLRELRGEAEVKDHVVERLRWDKGLVDLKLDVEVKERKATLRGAVNNPDQKRRAVELVQTTVGIEEVVDEVTLAEAPATAPAAPMGEVPTPP